MVANLMPSITSTSDRFNGGTMRTCDLLCAELGYGLRAGEDHRALPGQQRVADSARDGREEREHP